MAFVRQRRGSPQQVLKRIAGHGCGGPTFVRREARQRILNSVDRSRPLQVYLGWFRFICSNGLIIGEEFARLQRRHVRSLELDDIQKTVSQHVSRLTRDAETLLRLWNAPIENEAVSAW